MVVICFKVLALVLSYKNRENHDIINQYRRPSVRESNTGPPEYGSGTASQKLRRCTWASAGGWESQVPSPSTNLKKINIIKAQNTLTVNIKD
jgi:hypothetical protein